MLSLESILGQPDQVTRVMPEKMNSPLTQAFSPHDHVEPGDQIYVGIVASHSLVGDYLCNLIKSNNKMLPVILGDGAKSVTGLLPDANTVVLIDLCGLPLPASEYLGHLSAAIPNCSFLALDRAREEMEVARFLREGFSGFIRHDEVLCVLGPAISAIAEGRIWTSPEVIRLYMNLTSKRTAAYGIGIEMLTVREHQVMELLRMRYSNKEIAGLLKISESTVKFHVSNVLMKSNVNHRRDLTETEPGSGTAPWFPADLPEKFGTPVKLTSSTTNGNGSARSKLQGQEWLSKNEKTGS
jgi:two-component system, NarL family, response regulator LiaR